MKEVNPSIASLNNQIKAAFTEYMLTTFHIPKGAIDAYWDIFYKSLKWRIYPERQIGGNFTNCLFVHIPRTGGGSINSILNQNGGHKSALRWRRGINTEMWNRLFKFSIVRNPYSRFMSGYHWSGGAKDFGDVNEHLKRYGMRKLLDKNIAIFSTQASYLLDDNDQIMVDYVGRFERLEEEWKHLASIIGCSADLPLKNDMKESKQVLNDESKEVVYTTYKKDFEVFNYDK